MGEVGPDSPIFPLEVGTPARAVHPLADRYSWLQELTASWTRRDMSLTSPRTLPIPSILRPDGSLRPRMTHAQPGAVFPGDSVQELPAHTSRARFSDVSSTLIPT